jgi:carboxymethylenebutenolidase
MTATSHEWITLEAADGASFQTFVASPSETEEPHAGVIVLQEIWGVNDHIRDVADRFARLGYLAAAPDIFHRTAPRFEAPYTEFSGAEHAKKVTADGARADISAVHALLRERLGANADRVAACGFCMGGRLAYLANSFLPLSCAVSFYGGGIAQNLDLAEKQHAPLLLFWAGKDNHITKEHRRAAADALENASKQFVEVSFAQAQHGFFCDQRASHDPAAAREAWALVRAFLDSHLA